MKFRSSREEETECDRMKFLRSMCGVTCMDRVRNEEVHRTDVMKGLAERAKQRVLRWFGHVDKKEEEQLVKKIVGSDATGVRPREDLEWEG